MARITAKNTLAAVALAAATFATPAFAYANDFKTSAYDDCRTNTQDQVVAGTIGAVLGGIFGSQVSGNGARTEGSVLGAVLGGAAGAAIADGSNDCDKIKEHRRASNSGSIYNTTGPRTVYTSPRVQTIGYNGRYNQGYSNTSYGYNNRRYDPVDQINRRIDHLRHERAELKDRRRYGNSYRIDRRLYDISCELDELKKKKRRVKRAERRRKERHYY